ncbi:MAG: TolB family protein [Planctomycetota bacterium]|jgi:hypothetical protein
MNWEQEFTKFPVRFMLAVSLKGFRVLKERTFWKKRYFTSTILKEDGSHIFFGYYDHKPFSAEDLYLLALRVPFENRRPQPNDSAEIVYFEVDNLQRPFTVIGQSTTWCWQQGCRLQWFPRRGKEYILYNRMVRGRYGCIVQHIHTQKIEQEFTWPIYDVSPDGRWGLSLNFSRLERLRPGYGYVDFEDTTRGSLAPADDGIFRVDFVLGNRSMLFSAADVASFHPVESMRGAEHYFNHISINPTGQRFLFIHLWEGSMGRFGRLITCDSDGRNWHMLNNDGHTSHYTWQGPSNILAYATHRESGTHFYEYEDLSNERRIVGERLLKEDGHPSYSPDGRWILVDTYPDRCRDQHLYLYDTIRDIRVEIARFYSPFHFWKDLRCDLHPRWSPSGHYVCVDVPQLRGFRALGVLDARRGMADLQLAEGC